MNLAPEQPHRMGFGSPYFFVFMMGYFMGGLVVVTVQAIGHWVTGQ